MEIDKRLTELRDDQKRLKAIVRAVERFCDTGPEKKQNENNLRKRLVKLKAIEDYESPLPSADEVKRYREKSGEMVADINKTKGQLKEELDKFTGIRKLRADFLNDGNVISVFDSELTRTCGLLPDTLTTALITVKTCYFKVLHDLIHKGFSFNGRNYVCYTASAGQIRTKRTVFIDSELLKKHANTLMCGISIEDINAVGGVNINKFLAYSALTNSATDRWEDFDIDRCIVVNDMETLVPGVVDYIDENTYEITRRRMEIPIEHTDGCGMILPELSKKNFMIRAPWIKGLMGSFGFDKFIREANRRNPSVNHGVVKDIYGKEYDILADNIQVIFTKSMFKMNAYYKDWQSYKDNFKRYNCHAGICNMEPDKFDRAKINYQMLQTLVDLSDDELLHLSGLTIEKLHNISHDRDTMLSAFGATERNSRINPFQECLKIYPELLQDEYCRDTLRQIKKKIENEAVAGRLDVSGVYSFLLPDLYAFCQRLFLGDENPSGLLGDGEVYCRLFEPGHELDCLRSPHLYKEHAVRKNVYKLNDEAKRWFQTDGLYTSCHDLISRILQFDNDGDKSLIIDDIVLTAAAKRNMEGVVPLYYLGLKGPAQEITPSNIYNSLIWAYTSCNIGVVSNEITKIWNGNEKIDLDLVKYLCQDNNLVIDAAKNLYRPPRPDFLVERLKPHTQSKVPYFFMEAKDKFEHQVAPINDSCVNRLRSIIPKKRLNFSDKSLGKFNWKMLISSDSVPNNEISAKIIDSYRRISSNMRLKFNDETDCTNTHYLCRKLRDDLLLIHGDEDYVVDVLVKHLFYNRKTKNKSVFWECYGAIVLRNLKKNVDQSLSMCSHCGKRYFQVHRLQYLCETCYTAHRKKQKMIHERTRRAKIRGQGLNS